MAHLTLGLRLSSLHTWLTVANDALTISERNDTLLNNADNYTTFEYIHLTIEGQSIHQQPYPVTIGLSIYKHWTKFINGDVAVIAVANR